jgi:hypothetical protein
MFQTVALGLRVRRHVSPFSLTSVFEHAIFHEGNFVKALQIWNFAVEARL